MGARMQAKRFYQFDPQIFLEALMCSVFACLLLYLAASGQYLRYLAPRMKPYLYFAAAVMLAWAVAGAFRMLGARRRPRCAHCAVLLIPILLILIPHRAMGASDVSFGYVAGGAAPSGGVQSPDGAVQESGAVPGVAAETDVAPAGLAGLDVENRRITVGENDYYLWICEIYDNLDTYAGYTLTVTGYVLKGDGITGEGEFVPARLMMSCCVADLVACGILCRYDGAGELENDAWVTVEGVIEKGEYMGYPEARLTALSVIPAEPIESFVYTYSQ
ncbi:MAG: TIGR03943 family protein [Oscillospiraceae bacterium]|jgi:putative membrane protein|nr:TIGR03943 family protein [Oscillospiraceae bacterium]